MKQLITVVCAAAALLTGCSEQAKKELELTPMQMAANYLPRIGIAVHVKDRVCIAIQNMNLAASSPLTLVKPTTPQTFLPARIAMQSDTACPIKEPQDKGTANYDLRLPNGEDEMELQAPYIAVIGDPGSFLVTNVRVQADLDGTKEARMFASCRATDGRVLLTVWSGIPNTSTKLWGGVYQNGANVPKTPPCQ